MISWESDLIGFENLIWKLDLEVGFQSWIRKLDLKVGFESWIRKMDLKVGFERWIWKLDLKNSFLDSSDSSLDSTLTVLWTILLAPLGLLHGSIWWTCWRTLGAFWTMEILQQSISVQKKCSKNVQLWKFDLKVWFKGWVFYDFWEQN